MQLTLSKTLRTAPPVPSDNVLEIASLFGIGLDTEHEVELIPPTSVTLAPHQLTFISGPSGSGKSTLLRLLHDAAAERGLPTLRLDELPTLPDVPLVDALDAGHLPDRLRLLSLAGLNDAFTLLRTPAQLSDGQRFRLQLAQAFAHATPTHADAERSEVSGIAPPSHLLLIDEFAAALDRATASAIAANLRRWVNRTPVAVAVATTHDDLLEPLSPDVLIYKPLGAGVEVVQRQEGRSCSGEVLGS